jgi:hypothetical protein
MHLSLTANGTAVAMGWTTLYNALPRERQEPRVNHSVQTQCDPISKLPQPYL